MNKHQFSFLSFRIRKILTCLFFLCINGAIINAQKYKSSEIQPELLANANCVVRNSDETLTYDKFGNIRHEKLFAITILDKSADEQGYFVIFYDKMINIIDLECRLFDKGGNQTRIFKLKDFRDQSAVSGYSLYEDKRIRYLMPVKPDYPYTVEYKSVVYYRGTFNFPDWDPVPDYNCSVESAKYTLKVPPEQMIIFRHFRPEQFRFIVSNGETNNYTWELAKYKAIEVEPFSPPGIEIFPGSRCAFEKFTYSGTSGSMANWQEFGKWVYSLNKGRDVLPPQAKEKVHSLLSGCESEMEKVKKLYNFLQSSTRYVSIQIGLGGYQPMDASSVFSNGYGDCKALSNYMMAMLKEAGIESFYTLVRAGEAAVPILEDFPVPQFNHVILCVPLKDDTIWLECTDQSGPFGFQGDFTSNRKALLISEQGGKLVSTLRTAEHDNLVLRKAKIELIPGSEKVNSLIETNYSGIQLKHPLAYKTMPEDVKRKTLLSETPLNIFELKSYDISFNEDWPKNTGKIVLQLEIPAFLSKSGDRYFMPRDPFKRDAPLPRKLSERMNEIYIRYSKTETDTIVFFFAGELEPEFIPPDVSAEQSWGAYNTMSRLEDGKLLYIRHLKIKAGHYPASSYPDFYNFFSSINKADNAKILLRKRAIQ